MKIYVMVTYKLWCARFFLYNNQRGITQKLRKGEPPFLYGAHRHDLKKCMKISQMVTDLWGVQEYLEKKIIKGAQLRS